MDIIRLHAPRVSTSEAGDYYQLSFGPEQTDEDERNPSERREPYLIIQRQFEMPDGGESYIEMHDEDYIGHFRLQLIELSRTRLAFKIARKTNTQVEVDFSVEPTEFAEVRRVGEILFGLREPRWGEDDDAR